MIEVFRCLICGETYLGEKKPSNCPFCGAHTQYLIKAKLYKDVFKIKLGAVSRNNLKKTLKLEMNSAEFYLCAAKAAKNVELYSMFKRLAKVEYEHAEVACKYMKRKVPALKYKKKKCFTQDLKNLKDAYLQEDRAIGFYRQFAKQAKEPNIKRLFTALIEIETDHLKFLSKKMKR
ncbi:MAG: ferritin-like domain-containing protein [Nanoarchaeota archaeon]|nr:ferritin-like domain-containing protein [Nanoarchaeota archaeon]